MSLPPLSTRVATLALLAAGGFAQSERMDRFEAVAIKSVDASAPMGYSGGPGSQDPERMSWLRASVTSIISSAYPGSRVDAPAALDSQWYSITATIPRGATREQFQDMLKTMLAERFGLAVHHESRQVAVFEMTLVQPGAGLTPGSVRDLGRLPAPPPGVRWQYSIDNDAIRKTFQKASMELLANRLTFVYKSAPVPVVNKTGLAGEFDFRLELPAPSRDGEPEVGLASLSGALKKQLGIQLQKSSTTVDYVVVDHINKTPAEN